MEQGGGVVFLKTFTVGPSGLRRIHVYSNETSLWFRSSGAGQMAQWLRSTAALLEDRGLIPCNSMVTQPSVTPVPGD